MVANGAPILARRVFASRWEQPIDANRRFIDGQALLGPSKTWRGIVASLLIAPCVAVLLGMPASVGLLIALTAMAGDLLSSFCKRRLHVPPSGMALGLDQIPESLLPLLAVQRQFALAWLDILQLTLVFMALELVLSRFLYYLHIRK
ncbi:MAG: CDP-archaeol synthase, partial [Gammaproteobacteria bacterium]|nr:CDP-archaeol synthase [Gammaproteobacteria bacterium]